MSFCNIDRASALKPWPDECARCGAGPCEVWRNQTPPGPMPRSKNAANVVEVDPALLDARARAFDLAMRLAAQSEEAEQVDFDRLVSIANRIVQYLAEGR